jgi:hypothetical protein
MADELLALLDQEQQQQQQSDSVHQAVSTTTAAAAAAGAAEVAEEQQLPGSRAVSPSEVHASFAAEGGLEDEQQQQQDIDQQDNAELSEQEWMQQYAGWGPEQQMLRDMEHGQAAQEPGQQQQQRRRLSPGTLQRMHQESLAK